MPAIATTGLPQDPGFVNLTHKIVQLVMASASRASVAASGVPNVKLPQDRKSLEYAFEPLFSGTGARERQLRRTFGRPGGRVPIRLTGIDFADNRSVIEQPSSAIPWIRSKLLRRRSRGGRQDVRNRRSLN
jgi:hypothetical protein